MANVYVPFGLVIADLVSEENPVTAIIKWDVGSIVKSNTASYFRIYTCDTVGGAYTQATTVRNVLFYAIPTKNEAFWVKVSSVHPTLGESALSESLKIPPRGISVPSGGGGGSGSVATWVPCEVVGNGNGSATTFYTSKAYSPGSLAVYLNGLLVKKGSGPETFNEVSPASKSFYITPAPLNTDEILAQYIPV